MVLKSQYALTFRIPPRQSFELSTWSQGSSLHIKGGTPPVMQCTTMISNESSEVREAWTNSTGLVVGGFEATQYEQQALPYLALRYNPTAMAWYLIRTKELYAIEASLSWQTKMPYCHAWRCGSYFSFLHTP